MDSASAQQTRLADDHEIPWLERFLKRIRFFDSKYNFIYMIFLGLCPFVYEYLICRKYCDIDECRSQRNSASYYSNIVLFLYFVRIRYLNWSWKRQQAIKNASAASS
ncbi:hypothetical protein ACN38_g469 [Penicillium nordicum]|uniref:Uncharacterized protein n=1 Tax=Penicillium nordicum TaxID=229535 RepID=A0A0M8PAF0_9EURO|nr:hypothetical protein ACN38_g469 [Penicillium nordicum]